MLKFSGKGLITKLPGKNLDAVTEQGHRVAQFITKLHHRVLTPGLAYAQGTPAPAEMAHSSDALDRANLPVSCQRRFDYGGRPGPGRQLKSKISFQILISSGF